VISDDLAVDLIKDMQNPTKMAKKLVNQALNLGSTDNISCMVIKFCDETKEKKDKQENENENP
jgi:serine/threonine protein phosphatase PrpC